MRIILNVFSKMFGERFGEMSAGLHLEFSVWIMLGSQPWKAIVGAGPGRLRGASITGLWPRTRAKLLSIGVQVLHSSRKTGVNLVEKARALVSGELHRGPSTSLRMMKLCFAQDDSSC